MWADALERSWYQRRWWSVLLLPLSWLYGGVVTVRRLAYRYGWLRCVHLPVPVIVVGNITVGGNGKTPLTAEIARRLCARGLRVGIVSRGYGGKSPEYPLHVTAHVSPAQAGDEPVLLAARGDAVVMVDPVRPRAAQRLVETHGVQVILADDGLQHYPLARDTEIAVVDGRRGHGNGWLLPAGPLRESRRRLSAVDLILIRGDDADMRIVPGAVVRVDGHGPAQTLFSFAGQTVHAVAGIGAPQRFFAMLKQHGLVVIEHPMPDHHHFAATDIAFDDAFPVLMTEKDAVKCRRWADARHWSVPVDACLSARASERLDTLLTHCLDQNTGKSA